MGQYISYNNNIQELFGCADTLQNDTVLNTNTLESDAEPRLEQGLESEPEISAINRVPVLSKESKLKLTNSLLMNEIENRKLDNLKHARHDCLCKHVIDSLNQNISELSQDNKMLRESLEKYKKLYYDQLSSINDSINDSNNESD
jgi:vacuolar-type H+-ATPase subunit I/STV1